MKQYKETTVRPPPNKPAGFQFDVKQWLGDYVVMSMSLAEQGMHMKLMCIAWQETPPCTLPDDDKQISQWLGLQGASWKNIHKSKVMKAWKQIPKNKENAGRWVLDGLQRSYFHQENVLKSRTMAAHARWNRESDVKTTEDNTSLIWRIGLDLLKNYNNGSDYKSSDAKNRSLVGSWIKNYGEKIVAKVLAEASLRAHTTADPYQFITKALSNEKKQSQTRKANNSGDLVL